MVTKTDIQVAAEFNRQTTLASFAAELAFARLLLGMLFLATLGTWLWTGEPAARAGTLFSIAATACAWFAQVHATQDRERWFAAFRWACIVFSITAGYHLLRVPF